MCRLWAFRTLSFPLKSSFALCLILCALARPLLGDDHGDSFATATSVNVGSVTNGSLEIAGDSGCFKFTVSQQVIYVTLTRGTMDTNGELYDLAYTKIVEHDTSGGDKDFALSCRRKVSRWKSEMPSTPKRSRKG